MWLLEQKQGQVRELVGQDLLRKEGKQIKSLSFIRVLLIALLAM